MKHIQLLIKPASSSCNMKCTYCFYDDISSKRLVPNYGMMSEDTLEIIVQKALNCEAESVSFAFQGGEPTLCGLDFYKKFIELIEKHNVKNISVSKSIQTNGYIIDDEWAKFFFENKFLVGLSFDGMKNINDINRLDTNGNSTYNKVLDVAKIFTKHGVEFNILTVVTKDVALNIKAIYAFFKKKKLHYQQYIPCLDPFDELRGTNDYSLTPPLYAKFLNDLFELWFYDILHGEFIYIRFFENVFGMIKGHIPESCSMRGVCSIQNVIEADGSVFPCDFYVLDDYKIGNVTDESFDIAHSATGEVKFVTDSQNVNEKCPKCKYGIFCRGGCKRDRELLDDGTLGLNYYCESYYSFYDNAIPRLMAFDNSLKGNREQTTSPWL